MKKILVLCVGNACRSQMAEGYLDFYAGNKAQIYSAGLESHGLNPYAVEVMAEDSIDISENYSKIYTEINVNHYDYLIAICDISNVDLPDNIQWDYFYCFNVADPAKAVGSPDEIRHEFRKTREEIKKHMLQFIGKELISESNKEFMSS
ncbi:MAG: arsenate reductase ArsC [Saprospiraceae bacterium]|nr:arsenate reductase ArsC [Saprospiraceae bacterium]